MATTSRPARRPDATARPAAAWAVVLVITLFMLWPLLLEGRPSYFADSLSYQRGGGVAVDFLVDKIEAVFGATPESPPAAEAGNNAAKAGPQPTKAARSISYSVIAYLLAPPGQSMLLVAVIQALSVALIVAGFMWLGGRSDLRSAAVFGAVMALLTPAALVAAFIMPDIFAGVLIGAIALLATAPRQWSTGYRVILVLLGALAVSAHTSHVPIAFAVTAVAIGVTSFARSQAGGTWGRSAWVAGPLVLGLLVTMATGFIGFGEVSVAPKRYPLTLARSIVDGPARLYLEEQCPGHRYAICELLAPPFPTSIERILWGDTGIINRATPDQLERIRKEEPEIVWQSALAHPRLQVERIANNIGRQLVAFDVLFVGFEKIVVTDFEGELRLDKVPTGVSAVTKLVNTASTITLALSLAWLLAVIRRMDARTRLLFALVAVGIVTNAVVCAVFSGVADRYQARVIWLLPLLALSHAIGRKTPPSSGRDAR